MSIRIERLLTAHAAMRRQANAAGTLLKGPSEAARASLRAAHQAMRDYRDEIRTLAEIATVHRTSVPALTETDIRSYITRYTD